MTRPGPNRRDLKGLQVLLAIIQFLWEKVYEPGTTFSRKW